MSDKSSIEWTDATWNPVRGCTKISPGCKHCYAETFAERWRGVPGHPYEQGFDLRLVPEKLTEPLRWKQPRRVFVNSMSDLFQDGVPDDFIAAVFGVMSFAGHHTFQVLTKRAERMRQWVSTHNLGECQAQALLDCGDGLQSRTGRRDRVTEANINGPWPLPNVWLGVSVENQEYADERIPLLLQTPAAVRFLSCEPLLEALELRGMIHSRCVGPAHPFPASCTDETHPRSGIDWCIVGGESGPGARPCDVEWVRSVVKHCKASRVACFVKQLGGAPRDGFTRATASGPGMCRDDLVPVELPLKSKKGGEPTEWPEDLRVRQMPEARAGR